MRKLIEKITARWGPEAPVVLMFWLTAAIVALSMALGPPPARGQSTLTNNVPFDVEIKDKYGSPLALFAERDTVAVTYDELTGTPIDNGAILASSDSMYTYHNENKEWVITVSNVDYTTGPYWRYKLTRDVYEANTHSQDTVWVYGHKVYNTDPWGDKVDLVLAPDSSTSVGDQLIIYFRTLQPLKVDGDGLLQIDVAKPDSFNTY